jgi:hypothetical protein
MAGRPGWAPEQVDPTRPSIARVYDYYLGGSHNFESDRALARSVLRVLPDLRHHAQQNRAFLRRAVRWLSRAGIDQFLDLGSGIPTVGNVHEVARSVGSRARVVYVDHDPVAITHSQHMLAGDDSVIAIEGDLRASETVLDDPVLRRHLDLGRPVGVLFLCVLHFVTDEHRPADIVRRYLDAVAPGSYLALSHASFAAGVLDAQQMYNSSPGPNRMQARSHEEIESMFSAVQLIDPGLVRIPLWRPDNPEDIPPTVHAYPGFAGVGRRP